MVKNLTEEQKKFIEKSYKVNTGTTVQNLFEMKYGTTITIATILNHSENKRLYNRWEQWEIEYIMDNCDYSSELSVKRASDFLKRTVKSTYAKAREQHFRNRSIDHGMLMFDREQSLEKANEMLKVGRRYRVRNNLPKTISALSDWTECEVIKEYKNFFLLKIGDYNESVSKINLFIGEVEVKGSKHESN